METSPGQRSLVDGKGKMAILVRLTQKLQEVGFPPLVMKGMGGTPVLIQVPHTVGDPV